MASGQLTGSDVTAQTSRPCCVRKSSSALSRSTSIISKSLSSSNPLVRKWRRAAARFLGPRTTENPAPQRIQHTELLLIQSVFDTQLWATITNQQKQKEQTANCFYHHTLWLFTFPGLSKVRKEEEPAPFLLANQEKRSILFSRLLKDCLQTPVEQKQSMLGDEKAGWVFSPGFLIRFRKLICVFMVLKSKTSVLWSKILASLAVSL